MKIKFTTSERRRFLEGLQCIRQNNPTAAHQFRKKTEIVLSRLSECPESGRVIPEFPELPHREVIVRPYRFFYRVVGKTLWIVAGCYSAQLPVAPVN